MVYTYSLPFFSIHDSQFSHSLNYLIKELQCERSTCWQAISWAQGDGSLVQFRWRNLVTWYCRIGLHVELDFCCAPSRAKLQKQINLFLLLTWKLTELFKLKVDSSIYFSPQANIFSCLNLIELKWRIYAFYLWLIMDIFRIFQLSTSGWKFRLADGWPTAILLRMIRMWPLPVNQIN